MNVTPESIGGYKVIRELGRGAMGTVYLANQESLGRELAIKIMAPEFTRDPEFVARFRREGQIAARLRHPNIVQVYDFCDRDGLYFIAMEYLGSRTLKSLVQERGRVPIDEACRLTHQVLSALEHAHAQGIIHRDIKPANVMLTDQGEAALTDFSIAQMKSASRLTATGSVLGTPEYMAPEQFEGKSDSRADLYATGILLYEMLTGFSPFHAETIAEIMKKQLLVAPDPPAVVDFTIPEPISAVVVKSLVKDPDQRYQSAAEMRQALVEAVRAARQAGKIVLNSSTPQAQPQRPGLETRVQSETLPPPPEAARISQVQAPPQGEASPPVEVHVSADATPAERAPKAPQVSLWPAVAEGCSEAPLQAESKTEAGPPPNYPMKGLLDKIDDVGDIVLSVPSGLCLLAILPRLAFSNAFTNELFGGAILGLMVFFFANLGFAFFLLLRRARWNRILSPLLISGGLLLGLIVAFLTVLLPVFRGS